MTVTPEYGHPPGGPTGERSISLPLLGDKKMKQCLLIVAVVLATTLPAWAQETAKAPAEAKPKTPAAAPEVMRNAVDPYVPAVERARFFRAAGKDNELTADEFAADRKRTSPFIRTFDHWAMMIRFDKNGSKTIDWFEADMYRRQVRKEILEVFDITKDHKLRGGERAKANAALAGEKFLAGRLRHGEPRPAFGGSYREELLKRHDTNKDGQISDEERRAAFAAMRERGRQHMLDRYDEDKDGQLSADERAAMRADRAGPWKDKIREWQLRDYDLDGDGELDEKETAELKAAEEKFKTAMKGIGKMFELRLTDLDGDGEVTAEERAKVREQWKPMMFKGLARVTKYADLDGDGTASPDEWIAFRDRASVKVMNWMEAYGMKFDADDNGRLDAGERDALMKGMRDNAEARLTKYDADKNGLISPDEALDMAEGFLQEVGLDPRDREEDDRRRN